MEVRPAARDDQELLESFLARCSDETLYRRFHGVGRSTLRREVTRVVGGDPAYPSWVAVAEGEVIGLASLALSSRGEPAEVGVVVRDDWRRRGVGRALLRALSRRVVREHLGSVGAQVQGDNASALRFFSAVSPPARREVADGVVTITIAVPVAVPDLLAAPSTGQVRSRPVRGPSGREGGSRVDGAGGAFPAGGVRRYGAGHA